MLAVVFAVALATPLDWAECSPLHGCLSTAVLNRTAAISQTCVLQTWPRGSAQGVACAQLLDGAATTAPGSPPLRPPFCAFNSEAARSWLARLRASAAGCETVLFTVITGGTDLLSPLPSAEQEGGERMRVCSIALLDRPPREAEPGARAVNTPADEWFQVRLPATVAFTSAGRVAHSLKSSMMHLFPDANWVLYMDGKALLRQPIARVIAHVANMTALPLIVLTHNRVLFPKDEAIKTRNRLTTVARPGWQEDLAQLAVATARYRAEGHFSGQPGVAETMIVLQQRAPPERPSIGLPLPSARMVLRAFECVWFNEIWASSMREQLHLFYVIDLLGMRKHVFMLPHKLSWLRTKEHADLKVKERQRH
jgi:hypothetical protein